MRTSFLVALVASCALQLEPAAPNSASAVEAAYSTQDLPALRAQAEKLYAEGSYALAKEAYAKALPLAAGTPDERWIRFRLADTRWRSLAGTWQSDASEAEAAQRDLEALVRDVRREDEKDRVFAEAHESLGDYSWDSRYHQDWNEAWKHYYPALEWWAGSSEIEFARSRYLAIVWKTAAPHGIGRLEYGTSVQTPDQVIENAIQIAEELDDRARAHVLRAITLQNRGGDWRQIARVPREFEAALEGGRSQPWYDDALFAYALWLNSRGRVVRQPGGGFTQEPDYDGALKLFQRITSEFRRGETRFWDDADQAARRILEPELSLSVDRIFLPDSKVGVWLSWRNLRGIEFSLYAFDPLADVKLVGDHAGGDWFDTVDLRTREPLARWTHDTQDDNSHRPGNRLIEIERELKPGAYLLAATGANVSDRELVLVSETNLVLEAGGRKVLAWVTSAQIGQPIGEARVKLWEHFYDGQSWRMRTHERTSDAHGLAAFELPDEGGNRDLLAFASSGERVAYARVNTFQNRSAQDEWHVQAFTERPVYRPEDTVRWKIVARQMRDGRYTTPAGAKLGYRVLDPRGTELTQGILTLSPFGSGWGEIALNASLPLGEFSLQLARGKPGGDFIAQSTFFRLEEYKLPEFEVSVTPAQVDGRPLTFKSGDEVQAEISAQSYAGGPVSNATVQVVVFQRPFWVHRPVPRDFPWFYEDWDGGNPWRWYGESEVVRQTLTTDADGKTRVTFATPLQANQDLEYRIEARVTDASRREVVGEGRVRVARQSYYVELRPRHNLHRPGDTVEVDVEAFDANERPVAAEGTLSVVRLRWVRFWRDPIGREVSEAEYQELVRRGTALGYGIARTTYEREAILTKAVRCGEDGKTSLAFQAEREGCYSVEWSSSDADGAPISASTSLWVARDDSTDLAWRRGELEIVLDRDTLRAGQEALVMISSSRGPCSVLFTVGSTELFSGQVVDLTGSVKLLRIPLDDRHVPNVFFRAQTVRDGQVWMDQEEVIVPPVDHFLEVQVEPQGPQVKPGEATAFRVTTRGSDGKPVSAEVAFSVIDESVLAIQGDYAIDPRRFFFGDKRPYYVQTGATASERRFGRLVRGDEGELVDERLAFAREENELRDFDGEYGARSDAQLARAGGAKMKEESKRGQDGPPAPATAMAPGQEKDLRQAENHAAGGELVVRSDFRATAFWQPDLVTDSDGTATVKVTMPQSLTRWRASARAATRESSFGLGDGSTRTNLPLTIRLQAPRFFVVGDVCTISALIDNHTDSALDVAAALMRDGMSEGETVGAPKTVRIDAQGQTRVDWTLKLDRVGPLKLQVRASAGELGDAMEKLFQVYEHGLDQLLAKSGRLASGSGTIRIELPSDRKPGTTSLVVTVTPSTAVTMLDALPYLIDYPYGCTEQTMSRFLPAAIVARTLRELGLDAEAGMGRVFGGVEGEYAAATHPKGKKPLTLVDEVTRKSLERLYDMQHDDGGWGWWKQGEGDRFMTAYVVWGLALARDGGLQVDANRVERAAQWLEQQLVEAELEPDLAAWMLHAISAHRGDGPSEPARVALDNLWEQRDKLNAYSRALFALAVHRYGQSDRARVLCDNLANGATIDRAPDTSVVERDPRASDPNVMATAHWGQDGISWRWSDGAVESTATVLRALLAIRPDHELVLPTANWLVRNRRGAQWSSTRDTAMAVLALCDYLKVSGEAATDVAFDLRVNGKAVASKSIARGEALSAPTRFTIPAELVRDGANEIEIARTRGTSALYFAIEARYFNREKPIRAAANEIFVRREYYALVPRKTLLKGYQYERVRVTDGTQVASGTRVETVLTLEAKNDLEYLMVEDLKPAGLEAVDLTSGGDLYARELRKDAQALRIAGKATGDEQIFTGRTEWTHRELRDREVALFLSNLPQGVWELRYEMRAEVPGEFQALPLFAQAMYVPEIRGNDQEQAFHVVDAP